MSTRDRKGVTLIDVGVVLILLLVAVALLLPATSHTLDNSRERYCKNRLKMIGLALHNYEETHRTFPPGWVSVRGPSSGQQEQSAYGWGTYILPYLDNAPLYKKIQFGADDPSFQSQSQQSPIAYASTLFPAYRCSIDRGADVNTSSSVPAMATSNYVGNFGVGIPKLHHHTDHVQGVFGCNSRIRTRDIRDGTTNTVLAGERLQPPTGRAWELNEVTGPFNSYWAGIPRGTDPLAIVATVTEGDIAQCGAKDPLNKSGPLNALSQTLQQPRCIFINKTASGDSLHSRRASPERTSAGFSSYHKGGANVLLGDASVRFINDRVDPQTWINLMRRADGTVLGEF